jgi:hypothetical protein
MKYGNVEIRKQDDGNFVMYVDSHQGFIRVNKNQLAEIKECINQMDLHGEVYLAEGF